MAVMGKPISSQEKSFQNVGVGPRLKKNPAEILAQDELASKQRERLLGRITGYKEKNELVVDGKNHNKMGKDEFLRLLTVQLQNQDPMNPMKQEKMAAELAQFSQLEQLSNLNSKFDGLTKNQQVQDKFYGASFLGKEVVTKGSSLKFEGEGSQADILYTLPKPADKVLIRIFDNSNNMVGEIWKENIGRGNQNLSWDGLQLDKTYSAAGEFQTRIFAWDKFADPIKVETKTTGKVESVFFENGETVLKVDGKKVFLRDVDSFHNAKSSQLHSSHKNSQIRPGDKMEKALNNRLRENNSPTKLPLEASTLPKVELNKIGREMAVDTYKKNIPTTGMTSVYDE